MKKVIIVIALATLIAGCASDGTGISYQMSTGATGRDSIEASIEADLKSND